MFHALLMPGMVESVQWLTRPRRILFLLLPGFDDVGLAECLGRLRAAGEVVSVVGVSRRTVRGRSGRLRQPDLSLADITRTDDVAALVLLSDFRLAGGQFTDPRIGRLVTAVQQASGAVFATPAAALALRRTPFPTGSATAEPQAILTIFPDDVLPQLAERLRALTM